jgi:superoxide reductase
MNKYSCEGDTLCGVNKVKDKENMTHLEKKHTPVIDSPEKVNKGESFEITVEVGKYMKYPNTLGHFIQWIELYSGNTFLGRAEFTPEFSNPKIKMVVMLTHGHPLIAVERCNLHGFWSSEPKPIKIVQINN